jgi:hypothetical protein
LSDTARRCHGRFGAGYRETGVAWFSVSAMEIAMQKNAVQQAHGF